MVSGEQRTGSLQSAGGIVVAGGGEGIEAQLSSAGVDVIGNGLQGLEVGDLVQGVAGLFCLKSS